MDFNSKKAKPILKWVICVAGICLTLFLIAENISIIASAISWLLGIVMPLIVGFALALIFNVPLRFFESKLFCKTKKPFLHKLRRPLAFIISLILIFGIIVGIIWLVIPALIEALTVIIQSSIDYINKISAMDKAEIEALPFGSFLLNTDWDKLLTTLQEWLKNQGSTIVNTAFVTISSLLGGVFDTFVSIVFSIYILFSKETLKSQFSRLVNAWLPKKLSKWLIHALSIANVNFRNFVSGQSIEAVIIGVLCLIGMLLLGIPYAPMVSALVGVTALIPVVGAFIGAIVGAFMILTASPIKAVIFIIFLVILQQLEGNLIYPKVMGNKVKLPGLWVLAAVTIGGALAGPVGMLLSVPVASTVYTLVKEATKKREENKISLE